MNRTTKGKSNQETAETETENIESPRENDGKKSEDDLHQLKSGSKSSGNPKDGKAKSTKPGFYSDDCSSEGRFSFKICNIIKHRSYH